jgi:hypothetical protein
LLTWRTWKTVQIGPKASPFPKTEWFACTLHWLTNNNSQKEQAVGLLAHMGLVWQKHHCF